MKPYLVDGEVGQAAVVAKHGNKIRKLTGFSFRNSITESSLARSCSAKFVKASEKTFYTAKINHVRVFNQKTVLSVRDVAWNRNFVSTSFNHMVNILREYLGREHEGSTFFEIHYRQINKVEQHYTKKYETKFDDSRKTNKDHFEKYIKKKLSSLPISEELKNINKSDLLVSIDYNSLYLSANAHEKSTWPALERARGINPEDSGLYCEMINTGQWASLNKTGFFKVKFYNLGNLLLQLMAAVEDFYNETKTKCKCVNRLRNYDLTEHLTNADIEGVVKTGSFNKNFFEGFICDNLDFNPFKECILDMTAKEMNIKSRVKTSYKMCAKKLQTALTVVVLDAIFTMF